jgi:hypothetical protein
MPSIIVDDKIVREKLSRDMFYTISELIENTFYVYIDDNEIEKVVDKQIENIKKEVTGALRTITNL